MDVYPRTRIWPYLSIILVVFVVAVRYPNWRIGWEAGSFAWQELRDRVGDLPLWEGEASEPLAVDVQVTPAASAPDLRRMPLSAPVAGYVAVHAAEEFAESAEAVATANFPSEVLAAEVRDNVDVVPDEDSIGPLLPPGRRHTSSAVSFSPASTDIGDFSNLLPVSTPSLAPPDPLDSEATVAVATWPRADVLWTDLAALPANSQQLARWIEDVRAALSELEALPSLSHAQVPQRLHRLEELAAQTAKLELYLASDAHVALRCLRYGIERRCTVWRGVHRLAIEQRTTPLLVSHADAGPVVAEVDRRLAEMPHTDSWRRYLMVPQLTQLANESWGTDVSLRRDTARTFLRRVSDASVSDGQKLVLQDPAIQDLARHLANWADRPIELTTLVRTLEQFEQARTAESAQAVVSQLVSLEFCRLPSASDLRRSIDVHYRNANVRLSVSETLLNDLLPVLKPVQQRIRDTILGANVVGRNRTTTGLELSLVNSEDQIRMRLLAQGRSRSRTVSSRGPVRFFSREHANFRAGKDMLVSPRGIYVTKATATARGQSQLLDLRTDYDQIPLLGWVVRQMALDAHEDSRRDVRQEVNRRVRMRARRQMDDSVHERLTGAEAKLEEKLLRPLRDLDLNPTAIEMRTTAERLVMRFRLAGQHQLSAYTPRPRALRDNVLSLQLHESAANNSLQQLELEDKRIELEELVTQITEKLRINRQDLYEDIPEDVQIRLAKQLPIHFEFAGDRVYVVLRIQELKTPKRRWRNFVVRGRYRADVGQTHINLERDGGIQLISERLGFRDQIALRGIFTKVMANNHRLNILRGKVREHAELNQLGVTQFVSRDGWIGISVGVRPPQVTAQDESAVNSETR